jgi:membrane protein YqaA with SNARE-associated domain
MRLTRRGRAAAYAALFSAAFFTGFALPIPPHYAPCAICTTHIERHP